MVIFFKKGNRKYFKSYTPTCLLSHVYNLFTKIKTTRPEKRLDEHQPREQAAFMSKYSMTDHIHAINQLKEMCSEYNILLCVAFLDYAKAFDSVQTQAILTALQEQLIEYVYNIDILEGIYTDSSVTVHLHNVNDVKSPGGKIQYMYKAGLVYIKMNEDYIYSQTIYIYMQLYM